MTTQKERMAKIDEGLAPLTGRAAIPRDNGEPIFTEPWEATSFGLAATLTDMGHMEWKIFQKNLIKQVQESDAHGGCEPYYESWTKALRACLIELNLATDEELRNLEEHFSTPHAASAG